jgi:xanthine dehydrogenase YagT iron-sulfur-binding subunit
MSSQRETKPHHNAVGEKFRAASATTVSSDAAFGVNASSATPPPSLETISLKVNGNHQQLEVDTRTTLLDALREHFKLTGTKKGCDHGQCGACTVIVNGRRINACLTLAVMQHDAEITTIEGLGTPEKPHPLQTAFIKHDGYQCGYCTPGQICSTVAVLEEIKAGIPSHVTHDLVSTPEVTADEIRERMSGNICRCGAYSNILAAIEEFAEGQKS